MRNRKWMVLLTVMMFLVICGCTKKEEPLLSEKNPTTVTLWHYYVGENQQALESAVSDFNQGVGMENGIIVEAVAKGSIAELEQAVTESAKGTINAEPMPDLFSSYPDKAMEIDALGMVCDLNDYFTAEEQALYISDFLADGIFGDGRLLLLPVVKSTELLYLNESAWNEFAADKGFSLDTLLTWEGIYDAAAAYYEWSGGKALMGFDSVANYIIIGCKQQGINVIDGDNARASLDEKTLTRVFDLYYNGFSLGYFDAIGRFRSDDIKSGDLLAYVGSSSSAAYFPTWIEQENTQQDIDFAALQGPVFAGGTAYAIQQGAGMCVAKTTEQKQAGAAVFLKWFTDPVQNIHFSMTTGYLPVQQKAYDSTEFNEVLDTLRSGDKAQNNVADVYEIALYQITKSHTYAAKPFVGSYDVRTILQSSLMDQAQKGRELADDLRQQGLSDAEILEQLDTKAAFEAWLADVTAALDKSGITYNEE